MELSMQWRVPSPIRDGSWTLMLLVQPAKSPALLGYSRALPWKVVVFFGAKKHHQLRSTRLLSPEQNVIWPRGLIPKQRDVPDNGGSQCSGAWYQKPHRGETCQTKKAKKKQGRVKSECFEVKFDTEAKRRHNSLSLQQPHPAPDTI